MSRRMRLARSGPRLHAPHMLFNYIVSGVLNHRVQGDFFDSDGVQLHYTDEGEGAPVILLHGVTTNSDLNWRCPGTVAELAKHFRVICLDLRGHGLSEKPHDACAYGEELAHDVIRLMDHLGIKKAHVAGYSMGGYITVKLLELHPDRLLSAAPCAAGWDEVSQERLDLLHRIIDCLENGGFEALIDCLDCNGQANKFKHIVWNAMMGWNNDLDAILCLFRRFADLSVPESVMKRNKVPVRAIVGTQDPLSEQVRNLERVGRNVEACYLEGADHASAGMHPDFASCLIDFFEQHTPTRYRQKQQQQLVA